MVNLLQTGNDSQTVIML